MTENLIFQNTGFEFKIRIKIYNFHISNVHRKKNKTANHYIKHSWYFYYYRKTWVRNIWIEYSED